MKSIKNIGQSESERCLALDGTHNGMDNRLHNQIHEYHTIVTFFKIHTEVSIVAFSTGIRHKMTFKLA